MGVVLSLSVVATVVMVGSVVGLEVLVSSVARDTDGRVKGVVGVVVVEGREESGLSVDRKSVV